MFRHVQFDGGTRLLDRCIASFSLLYLNTASTEMYMQHRSSEVATEKQLTAGPQCYVVN